MDSGLETVIAAETILSDVDGQHGRLTICGHAVETLAAHYRFEDVIALLWAQMFEDLPDPEEIASRLGKFRSIAYERVRPHFPILAAQAPMEALRTALSLAKDGDDLDTALNALAFALVGTAAICRLHKNQEPIAPDPNLAYGADLLRMINDRAPSPEETAAINAYLVTVSDHGLNASTFTARVVASTQAGLLSATIAGASALKGPLHGGAPGPVLDMLDAIGTIDHASEWITKALDRGERLMGFGHRIYRVRDPRADALKAAALKLPHSAGRLEFAGQIETQVLSELAITKSGRKLETNVEYYTAILLEALNIPRSAFTCIFACARSAGWIAHAREQLATRRIVRPASVYVGPSPAHAA